MDSPPQANDRRAGLKTDEGWLTSRDGLRLFRGSTSPADAAAVKAHLALVHGYGEHLGRYRETMDRLGQAGYAVHGIDLRGHGKSSGIRAHVDAFGDYLADVDLLFAHVRGQAEGKKVFVLGHSLGGLILARWLVNRPEGVAGAVLSSPFMGLAFQPPRLKEMAAGLLDRLAPHLHIDSGLQVEQLTRDEAIRKATAADPLYQKVTTPRWFSQSRAAQRETLERASEITVPCLLLVGEADPIARPASGQELFSRLGSADKVLKTYDGFLHEVLNEIGRDRAFEDLGSFLDRLLG